MQQKAWLIVIVYKDEAISMFKGTQVVVTKGGKEYLGLAIRKQTFIERYVQQKVTTWVDELKCLSSVAITQPHAAFAAFTHGLGSRWTYLARTTPNIENLIKPLKEIFSTKPYRANPWVGLKASLRLLSWSK